MTGYYKGSLIGRQIFFNFIQLAAVVNRIDRLSAILIQLQGKKDSKGC